MMHVIEIKYKQVDCMCQKRRVDCNSSQRRSNSIP